MLNGRTWGPLRNRAGVSLPDAVKEKFGKGCPCCGLRTMVWRYQPRRGYATPKGVATRAHDFSVAKGGDPRCWFFACFQCNNDQGSLDLVTWVRKLVYDGDPRAPKVEELATFVRRWVAAQAAEEMAEARRVLGTIDHSDGLKRLVT